MKCFLKQREQTKQNSISPSAAPVAPHLLLQSLSTVVQSQCHIHNGPMKSHPNGLPLLNWFHVKVSKTVIDPIRSIQIDEMDGLTLKPLLSLNFL